MSKAEELEPHAAGKAFRLLNCPVSALSVHPKMPRLCVLNLPAQCKQKRCAQAARMAPQVSQRVHKPRNGMKSVVGMRTTVTA